MPSGTKSAHNYAQISVAVLALCLRIPLNLLALFLGRHNQREKIIL